MLVPAFASLTQCSPNQIDQSTCCAAIATATKCLREIEAIKRIRCDDADGGGGGSEKEKQFAFYLTPLGIHLSNLPVDARIGKASANEWRLEVSSPPPAPPPLC